MKQKIIRREPSSFRDPSGFVYYSGDTVVRQVNFRYKKHLDVLINSGLFDELIKNGCLVPHSKITSSIVDKQAYASYSVKKVPFISYPYEWTFSQLQDAALLTLDIQKRVLEKDMSLKDASAYNIQFVDGKPLLIDLLSFEKYPEAKPWVAYKQFCQHFLGPLLLMSYVDVRLNQLLKIHIDGIPLDLVSKLLPKRTFLSFSIASHIHLHAYTQKSFSSGGKKQKNYSVSKIGLLGIIDNLYSLISSLKYEEKQTEWGEYYTFTNYNDTAFLQKRTIVQKLLSQTKARTAWDIGANSGEFSRVASEMGIFTVSSDLDPIAVEKNYLLMKKKQEKNILPLLVDLTNPSPAIGWENTERSSFIHRGPADVVMALALIHHLAISNNLPFSHISSFCKSIGKHLIIEFVPKSDSQVKKLLSTREDIFDEYSQSHFEKSFSVDFTLLQKVSIPSSDRTLYLFKSK